MYPTCPAGVYCAPRWNNTWNIRDRQQCSAACLPSVSQKQQVVAFNQGHHQAALKWIVTMDRNELLGIPLRSIENICPHSTVWTKFPLWEARRLSLSVSSGGWLKQQPELVGFKQKFVFFFSDPGPQCANDIPFYPLASSCFHNSLSTFSYLPTKLGPV